jgi:hypothetical protein
MVNLFHFILCSKPKGEETIDDETLKVMLHLFFLLLMEWLKCYIVDFPAHRKFVLYLLQ